MKEKFSNVISEQIYNYLIDMILDLQIKPGERIPEASIAQKFNVSRTPIREALRDLAKDGIINLYPNRFSEVAIYDESRVREIGITKIYMDRLALKQAAYFGSRAEYDKLRSYAEKCYEAACKGDALNRIKSDSDFHWGLCTIGKNRSLMQLEKSLIIQIEYLQAANYLQSEDCEEQYRSHLRIVESLENGDLEAGLKEITEPSLRFYHLKDFPAILYT
ncbi:GntR family transcriptional regulator [Diplocloster agilis]|uniref:GntR family transcriptional regulator n=1 Tax=Diplocloster agilis TaxID=2850323 RepID=A0A949NFN9_9FIRM|nr:MULTISPECIES: GntR family transcriptional regulator [Lachnospiraceae]MBU9737899.1 GntR family transcriptional regulator [Diplocloster agilis]MBU9744578.1 GntR family transcriptional regulator [Diplocloster agilis]MCU6735342.1 GntR family transcriptional regulator [Suonthocola fibrivorans]SCJ71160.1 Uncharacterized HTH-type transcriptional regulator ydfH [uncultured Clostridium sp.]